MKRFFILVLALMMCTLLCSLQAMAESEESDALVIELDGWHPGVVGYDVQYTIHTYMNDYYAGYKNFTFSASDPDVTFTGNKVNIPWAVRLKGEPITVTVTHKKTGAERSLEIPVHNWEMTFSDEFEGDQLDGTKWSTFEHGVYTSVSVRGHNATISDGKLHLWIRKEKITMHGKTFEYSDAGVSTYGKFTQKYGLFTCSMKCPTQTSVNSAFWMIPQGAYSRVYMFYDKLNPMSGCSELDFIEYSAHWGNSYSIGEHYYDTSADLFHHTKSKMTEDLGFSPTEQFAEYACAWMPDAMYYYCNGKLMFTTTGMVDRGTAKDWEGKPGYIILTLGMYPPENTWCGPFNFTDEDFPIGLEVDYVRVYQ